MDRPRRLLRWLRHHPEASLLPVALTGLAWTGSGPSFLGGLVASIVAAGAVVTWSRSRWPGAQSGRSLHVRIALQVGALAAVAYGTGWGPALSLIFVFVVADSVRHSGPGVARPAYDWSLVGIAVGQLAIQVGLAPSHIPAPEVHGVAILGAAVLGAVTQRIYLMTREKEVAETSARTSEQRFRALVAHSADATLVVSADGEIAYQSSSTSSVLGYPDDALLGKKFEDLVHPADFDRVQSELELTLAAPGGRARIECRLRHAEGRWIAAESDWRNLVDDPHLGGLVVNTRDVGDRKNLEAQLHHRAFHDGLTGLANRHLFRDRVAHAVSRGKRRTDPFAVLFLDLDGFKSINDTLGHQVGDELLQHVALQLQTAIREHDTAARLGGDEFAVLLEDLSEDADAARVAERILQEIRRTVVIAGTNLNIDGSIGIAIAEPTANNALQRSTTDELLRNADIAMYMAKGAGKGRYEIFEPSMHLSVVERLRMESDLQLALDADELELHYQPIVTLDEGRIVGVEALLRWNHPQRGLISPADFIPLAEETGLIVPIGAWVIIQACQQIKQWQERYPTRPVLKVSVNVSPKQLSHGDVAGDVRRALQETDIDPASLTLEITETALMTDTEVSIEVFKELKELGVRLAVDDFGTGYSSLAYLQNFPFDVLKIDRSFIDGLTTGKQNPAVVRAIIELGRSLKLQTVAEGIEHDEQLERFRELECNFGQGFLFARPASTQDVDAFLSAKLGAPVTSLDELSSLT